MPNTVRSVTPTRSAMSRSRASGSAARHIRTWPWLDRNVQGARADMASRIHAVAFRKPISSSVRRSVCRATPFVQQTLHERHVEPPVELAAGLAFDADERETAACVQCSGRRAGRLDPGEDCVEPAALGDVEQFSQQQRFRCPGRLGRGARRSSPPRWCDRRPARDTATARRTRRPRRSPTARSSATMAVNAPDRAASHCSLVVERSRHEVERRRGGQHLVVVDRPDRLGVARSGGTDGETRCRAVGGRRCHERRVTGRNRRATALFAREGAPLCLCAGLRPVHASLPS